MKDKKVNVFIQNLSDTTTVLQQLRVCIEEIKKAIKIINDADLETFVDIVTLAGTLNRHDADTIELTVLHVDVVDVVGFVQSVQFDTELTLLTGDIAHIDVANGRNESALGGFVGFVTEVDAHH